MVAALPLLREVIIREGITILHGHGVRGGGVEARVRDGEWKDGGVREGDSMCVSYYYLFLHEATTHYQRSCNFNQLTSIKLSANLIPSSCV